MKVDYLASNTLHLVDCEITKDQVLAGWVFLDGGLKPIEVVRDLSNEISIDLKIHPKIQAIDNQTEFFVANDVIEFFRC